MSKQKNKNTPVNKFHVFEIKIEKNHFPKRKGNKAKSYANKVLNDIVKLHDSEVKLDIFWQTNSIYKKIFDKRIKQKRPLSNSMRISLAQGIESFDIEYENFSMRLYNYREAIRNFVTEFLNIKAFSIKDFCEDSKIRELNIDKEFAKFNKNEIGKIIDFRKNITHRSTSESERVNNLKDKIEEQKILLSDVTSCMIKLLKIQDEIAKKIKLNLTIK